MLKIGLTGGIGSGKSTVAAIFEILDIPVYYSDKEARRILYSPEVEIELKKIFGMEIFWNGKLSRQKLAEIVFSNKKKLKQLNNLIHPLVRSDFYDFLEKHQTPYVIKEAAILYESGAYEDMDFVITVYAPEQVRIMRVVKRENTTEKKVLQRMKNQTDEFFKIAKSDFIIFNFADLPLIHQVLKIHKILLKLAL